MAPRSEIAECCLWATKKSKKLPSDRFFVVVIQGGSDRPEKTSAKVVKGGEHSRQLNAYLAGTCQIFIDFTIPISGEIQQFSRSMSQIYIPNSGPFSPPRSRAIWGPSYRTN
jgi:hypothetical protein